MKDSSQNELLSAYLDGELTVEQRAKVEEMLSADPAARQLLDELRLLSTTLKSLPRHKLGTNLTESVLREAEHRMLTEPAETDDISGKIEPGIASEPDSSFSEPISKRLVRRMKNPRVWAWEAVIVAVVLMLMVYYPDQKQNQNAQPAIDAERNIAMAPRAETLKDASPEPPSMQAARPLMFSDNAKTKIDETQTGGKTTDGITTLGSTEKYEHHVSESLSVADTRAVKSENEGLDLAKKREAKPSDISAGMQLERIASDKEKAAELTSGDLLVVRCEITPDAMKNQAFDKLLAENGIVWSETSVAVPSDAAARDWNAAAPPAGKSGLSVTEPQRKPATAGFRTKIESLKTEPVEMVYVEASPEQIEATLNSLSTQTTTFMNVAVAQTKDNLQLPQFDAIDNQRRGLSIEVQARQKQAEQISPAQPQGTPMLTERGASDTSGITQSDSRNIVHGRAQRVPWAHMSDVNLFAQQTLDRKQDSMEIGDKLLPQSAGSDEMRVGRSYGAAARGGFGGMTGGYARAKGIVAGEQKQDITKDMPAEGKIAASPSSPAQNSAGLPSATSEESIAKKSISPARGDKQPATAQVKIPKPAAPASSPPPMPSEKPRASDIAQQEKSNQLFFDKLSDDSNFKYAQKNQSGSSASQGTQRVLFVFQLVDPKNTAEASKETEPTAVQPVDAVPSKPTPAKE